MGKSNNKRSFWVGQNKENGESVDDTGEGVLQEDVIHTLWGDLQPWSEYTLQPWLKS